MVRTRCLRHLAPPTSVPMSVRRRADASPYAPADERWAPRALARGLRCGNSARILDPQSVCAALASANVERSLPYSAYLSTCTVRCLSAERHNGGRRASDLATRGGRSSASLYWQKFQERADLCQHHRSELALSWLRLGTVE